jgi:hypothetical protein
MTLLNKFFYIAGLGILVFIPVWILGNRTNPHMGDINRIEKIIRNRDKVNAIVAGNSHANALDLSTLGLTGYRSWIGNSDLYEIRYQVEFLLRNLKHIEAVFVSISYFSFTVDNGAVFEGFDMTSRRKRHYAAFKGFKLINGDIKNFILGRLSWLIRADHWRNSVLNGFQPEDKETPVAENDSPKQKVASEADLISHAEFIADRVNKNAALHLKNTPNISELTYKELEALIHSVKQRGARLVFFTPPCYQHFSDRIDAPIKRTMRRNMLRLQKSYGVEYYDFSEWEEMSYASEYFPNSDHLNYPGSVKFTETLKASMSGY